MAAATRSGRGRSGPELGAGAGELGAQFEAVQAELRRLAEQRMARERPEHTLQATALVNEAWLRLAGSDQDWSDRGRFLAAAAEAMRRILVDHARGARAQKRGGAAGRMSISAVDPAFEADPEQVLALDEALEQLAEQDERAAEVARLRFFAGLGVDETADALGVSRRTVLREWKFARARLMQALGGTIEGEES
jgi:RNA polymerase sigma factor (TIGR02999 family)